MEMEERGHEQSAWLPLHSHTQVPPERTSTAQERDPGLSGGGRAQWKSILGKSPADPHGKKANIPGSGKAVPLLPEHLPLLLQTSAPWGKAMAPRATVQG